MSKNDMYNYYISDCLDKGLDCDSIKLFGTNSEIEARKILEELQDEEDWDESLDLDQWSVYVDKYITSNPRPFVINAVTIGEERRGIDQYPSRHPESSWFNLKRRFKDQGLSEKSIESIERSATAVWQRLTDDSRASGPVKGLVYGCVQSGKTANMEALISIAADANWNVFIILTGTIDSLRVQTRDRFKRDLCKTQSIVWRHLDFSGEDKHFSAHDLQLNPLDSNFFGARYVITCLKNKSRLTKLINWLYSDQAKTRRLRVIVIDDEADQASVNTETILDGENAEEFTQSRKEINRLIVCLANGLMADGTKPPSEIQAMNYVSFTATPYANVLNEPPGESLYPKNFIHSLQDPDEYFSCNVIFGNNDVRDEEDNVLCPGLDIIRSIPIDEVALLKSIHKDAARQMPKALKESLCWFLCAASTLRVRGYRKPITMLIHTSNRADDHFTDHDLVEAFLTETPVEEVLSFCKHVYEYETRRFDYTDFREDFSRYGALESVQKTYLPFSEIEQEIITLLASIGYISLDDDGEYHYESGINLCVDNYRSNSQASEGTTLRIIYPDKDQLSCIDFAPTFIVMGGNTLARGLTLEGLVCTYFSRSVTQADTLMQMARWFGYRFGYELLQRIWLTQDAWTKYCALAKVEMSLKREIELFNERGLSPEHLGIKVSTIPEIARFMPTSKKKMQSATICSHDFTGYSEELTRFDCNNEILRSNIDFTSRYLSELSHTYEHFNRNGAVIWEGVKPEAIATFFQGFCISEKSTLSDSLPAFVSWLLQVPVFQTWNVAVAGKLDAPQGTWKLDCGIELSRIERSRKAKIDDCIDIGSLRDGLHAICDIDEAELTAEQKSILNNVRSSKKNIVENRAKLGLSNVPLLLIYRIDKFSKPSSRRVDLGVEEDIISFSIIVPGDKLAGGTGTMVWINL